jgi:superoxide reductase
MTNYGDYYYCEICGHVVSILCPGNPSLVCCGQKMSLLKANTVDASKEKHVPVIVSEGDSTTIKLGSVPHPMTEEHHLECIEVVRKDGKYGRARLVVGGPPEATFSIKAEDIATVYAYCNLHGLWKAE